MSPGTGNHEHLDVCTGEARVRQETESKRRRRGQADITGGPATVGGERGVFVGPRGEVLAKTGSVARDKHEAAIQWNGKAFPLRGH